jgi:hypothetical protein
LARFQHKKKLRSSKLGNGAHRKATILIESDATRFFFYWSGFYDINDFLVLIIHWATASVLSYSSQASLLHCAMMLLLSVGLRS